MCAATGLLALCVHQIAMIMEKLTCCDKIAFSHVREFFRQNLSNCVHAFKKIGYSQSRAWKSLKACEKSEKAIKSFNIIFTLLSACTLETSWKLYRESIGN